MNTFSHFVFYVLSLGDILQYSIFYYFFRFNLFFNLFVIKFTFFLLLLWSKKGTQILLHYNHAASYLPYGTVPCLYTQPMIEKTKMNIKLCKSLSIFLLVCQAYSNDFRWISLGSLNSLNVNYLLPPSFFNSKVLPSS